MSVLITGGTGFIGSYIVCELFKKGEDIIVYDLYPNINIISQFLNKVKVVRGDVLDMAELLETIKRYHVDRVIHLAYLLITDSQAKPLKALQINCLGTNNIFEAARIFDLKKVVYASSTAVYGPAEYYCGRPVNEDSPVKPTTVYGACKVLNEFMGNHYCKEYGLDIIGLRPTIVYGPGRLRGGFTFVNDLIQMPALGKPVKVQYGDQEIDWQYVKDAANAFILALFAQKPRHTVFNVGGEVRTVREAADIVRKLIPNAKIELQGGTLGWVSRYDMSRARDELCYKPMYNLEDGIKDFIACVQKRRI